MDIEQVHVTVENGEMGKNEIKNYIHQIHQNAKGKRLKKLELTVGYNYVDLRYAFHGFPLERIRRVDSAFSESNKCVG